ncbi:MAG: 1-acyl-sn-glycerol-3-phosphate acyltransferase [Polyangiaceae bacterium]
MTRRLRAYRFIQRSIRSARRAGPDAYDEAAVQETLGHVGWLFGEGRYFGLDMRGLETLPPSPVMVVMNHSGGTTIPDVWGFGVAWYRHFGASRPLHLAAHDFVLATETTRRFFSRRGVLVGSRQIAREVLVDFARDLMVMPGGDVETWRPYRDRYRLRWGNRMGYASLALSCGIPIVPVAHAGAHETLMVLDDGRRLARALGLRRFRAHIWPIHLSLPWGLAIGPWPHLPLPANLRYRVGRALNEHALPIEDPTPSQTAALDAEVRRSLQSLLDELRYEADEKG